MSAFKTWLNGLTGKTTPVDADEMYLRDSVGAASNKVTWANLKATLLAYFDTAYLKLTGGTLTGRIKSSSGAAGGFELQGGGDASEFVELLGPAVFAWSTGAITAAINRSNEKSISTTWDGKFSWGTSTTDANGYLSDLSLYRDAAGTLAQRNGTNAQTKRIYGTYTDASNYRRVALAMTTAGVATLAPEGAGTGASGNVLHISGLPTSNPGAGILWNDTGTVKVGT